MSKAKQRDTPPKNQSKIKSKVRELAEKEGIKSSYGLQKHLEVAPTVAVNLWNDDVTRFSVETLELLCYKFSCDVGDILVFEPNARRHKPVAAPESSKPQSAPVSNVEDVRRRLKENAPVVASNPAEVFKRLKEASGNVKASNGAIGELDQVASDNEYVLTTAAAGELLNLSPRSVRENAEKGLLHGKQGKQSHWFFRRSDVDNFIAQRG
jgi:putative transcriptional regulator